MSEIKRIEWSAALETGVPAMDAQHRELIRLIQAMVAHHERGSIYSEMLVTYKELVGWAVKHFDDEEAFQESIDFPGLKAHRIAHDKLKGRAVEYLNQLESGTVDVVSLINFLSNWLTNHIIKMDTRYGQHAKAGKTSKRSSRLF